MEGDRHDRGGGRAGEGSPFGRRRFSLRGRRIPTWARRREVRLEAGHSLLYDERMWQGAVVVVEQGRLDLECRRGGHRTFDAGAVLVLDGIELAALHNPGAEPLILTAVTRRP